MAISSFIVPSNALSSGRRETTAGIVYRHMNLLCCIIPRSGFIQIHNRKKRCAGTVLIKSIANTTALSFIMPLIPGHSSHNVASGRLMIRALPGRNPLNQGHDARMVSRAAAAACRVLAFIWLSSISNESGSICFSKSAYEHHGYYS